MDSSEHSLFAFRVLNNCGYSNRKHLQQQFHIERLRLCRASDKIEVATIAILMIKRGSDKIKQLLRNDLIGLPF